MRAPFKTAGRVLVFLLAASLTTVAYEYPLSSESIREAYFLGRRRDLAMGQFLSRYVRVFPPAKAGPYVGRVEIRTPYTEIVYRADEDMLDESVVDAEQDYRTRALYFEVRVQIDHPSSGTAGSAWRDVSHPFQIKVVQGQTRKPIGEMRRPLYLSSGHAHTEVGTEIKWLFDPSEMTSAPLKIEITEPDGKTLATSFDLSQLK